MSKGIGSSGVTMALDSLFVLVGRSTRTLLFGINKVSPERTLTSTPAVSTNQAAAIP